MGHLEKRRQITAAVNDADKHDSTRLRAVKEDIMADGEGEQVRAQILCAAAAHACPEFPQIQLDLGRHADPPRPSWLYPPHWQDLSRRVRFERAGGVCQDCSRPHGATVRSLPDGRWYNPARKTWRDGRGRCARWPDLEQMMGSE